MGCLANMAANSVANQDAIGAAGALPTLVALLGMPTGSRSWSRAWPGPWWPDSWWLGPWWPDSWWPDPSWPGLDTGLIDSQHAVSPVRFRPRAAQAKGGRACVSALAGEVDPLSEMAAEAARALCNLAINHAANRAAIVAAGGIAPLVPSPSCPWP